MTEFTAACVTDLHLESGTAGEFLSRLETTLEAVLADSERGGRPDLLVVLGDVVGGTDPKTDRELLGCAADALAEFPVPTRLVPGNHDVDALDTEGVLSAFDQEEAWQVDAERELLFLDSSAPRLAGSRGELDAAQVEALQSHLPRMESAVIFVHHPLYAFDVSRNPLFEAYPEEAVCGNRREITEFLTGDNVAAVVNGHLHRFDATRADGVTHLAVDAFNKSPTGGEHGSYALVSRSSSGVVSVTHVSGTETACTIRS